MRIRQSPYHLLLLTALVLVLISFFLNQERTIDIHVHDTYYVIAHVHVFIIFAFLVWVLWFFYLLARKVLYSKALTWAHVVITLLTLLFLLFLLNYGSDIFNQIPKRYLDSNRWNTFNAFDLNMRLISYTTIALLLGQFIFIVNLIAGIVKRLA